MDTIPFLDLRTQYRQLRDEVLPALDQVCEACGWAQGPATQAFESEFAAYCGVKHCVTVNSGTSALHLALRCLGVGPGDEVITVPMTFIATAWGISYVGARPVFVDICPERRTLDPKKLEAAITHRTKAIIPVHLYGMPADMNPILEIANKHGISVIEDAAQAHGARYHGKRVGQFGVITCFSFYPGKNLGAYGEGGALVTNDEAIANHARALRDHAQSRRYHHAEVGYNYRMDGFQGAVLSIKLKHLDAWNAARRAHADRYNQLLNGLPLRVPSIPTDSESVWHLYVVETENRETIRQKLTEAGIGTGLHYPIPLHLQGAYVSLGYRQGEFPVTEKLADLCLSLPMYAELCDEQITAVCAVLHTALA
jgi:dTDP-4-amino-4,6-dideoxygalactose transaminase